MSDLATTSWTEVDNNNNQFPPEGWPAGMFPNAVEPTARADKGALKRWYNRANPTYGATQSTADSYLVTPTQSMDGYRLHEIVNIRMGIANASTSPTLAFSSLGPQPVRKIVGSTPTVLQRGDIRARAHQFHWDGTRWILRDPGPGIGNAPVAFGYRNTTTQSLVTGDNTSYTIVYGTKSFDYGENFATDTFTAPMDGVYLIQASVTFGPLTSSHTSGNFNIAIAGNSYRIWQGNPFAIYDASSNVVCLNGLAIIQMTAGQTATALLQISGGTKTVDIAGSANNLTRISGFRIT